jgi:hypothetical protein
MLLAEPHWPVWVPAAACRVVQAFKVSYRRLHHRYKHVTLFNKKCQEKATMKFKQTVVKYSVFKLAMLEAKVTGCM